MGALYLSKVGCEDESSEIEDDPDEVVPFIYTITSYGADYPVDALVNRLDKGNILIPEFQRGYVWKYRDACRFIESLLLGLPVPSIFLAKESNSEKLLVIDGNQRLKTLQYFYAGDFRKEGKGFNLRGVQEEFEGKTYDTLDENYKRKLDDSIIHAIIVKQDEPSNDNSSIYHIFERLNTGGRELEPQEIRACIYHGELNELLDSLNKNEYWRLLYGRPHLRLKDEELILRFFALYFACDKYKKPMKNFLNYYMNSNKDLSKNSKDDLTKIFNGVVEYIFNNLGKKAFRTTRQINSAIFDAIMVGIAKRISKGVIKNNEDIVARYNSLLSDSNFMEACKTNTSDEKYVERRIKRAIEAFDGVE